MFVKQTVQKQHHRDGDPENRYLNRGRIWWERSGGRGKWQMHFSRLTGKLGSGWIRFGFNLSADDIGEGGKIRGVQGPKQMRIAPAITTTKPLNGGHADHIEQHLSPLMLKTPRFMAIPDTKGAHKFVQIVYVPVLALAFAKMARYASL
jgi:hypothetical protein